MKKFLLSMALVAGISIAAMAQKPIKGRVLDDVGNPLVGANVKVKGTKLSTFTDEKGEFSFKSTTGKSVSVSFIGYQSADIAISDNISVVLSKKIEDVSEVVVTTALGIKRNPKEFGGSLTTLSAATLTKGKAVNIQQALNGKVAGVNISTINSGVFEDTKINFRGINY